MIKCKICNKDLSHRKEGHWFQDKNSDDVFCCFLCWKANTTLKNFKMDLNHLNVKEISYKISKCDICTSQGKIKIIPEGVTTNG